MFTPNPSNQLKREALQEALRRKRSQQVISYNPINGRYLPTDIVKQCFRSNMVTHVDKTLTGNGFTHAFLYDITPAYGKVNLLIEVNRGVVENKHADYLARLKKGESLPRIQFFYGSEKSDEVLNKSTEIVVAVVDTFVHESMFNDLLFDKILIDEFHTMNQQKAFRPILRGFLDMIEVRYRDSSIVTVTATPCIYQYNPIASNKNNINYVLRPTSHSSKTDIILNNNYFEVIKEAIDYVAEAEDNVIIFTNDVSIISMFTKVVNRRRVLEADLIVGDTLMGALVSKYEVSGNPMLKIISTKGFEGLDIQTEDNRVFIFQDLSRESQQFGLSNIIQALSRTRKGYKSAVYSSLGSRTQFPNIVEIKEKVTSKIKESQFLTNTALKKVLNSEERKLFKQITIQFKDKFLKTYAVVFDSDVINLLREKEIFLNKGIHAPEFEHYLKERSINLIEQKSLSKSIKGVYTRDLEYYYYSNRELILTYKLNEKLFTFDSYKSEFDYKLNKSYTTMFVEQWVKYKKLLNFEGDYQFSDRHKLLDELLEVKKTETSVIYPNLNKFIKDITKVYCSKVDKDTTISRSRQREKKADFKKNTELAVLRILAVLVNDEVIVSKKMNKGRDYNLFTTTSGTLIRACCDVLDRTVTELDISSCNARILYAMSGLELPNDFYGVGKTNKLKINILLNNFCREMAKDTNEGRHKASVKKSFSDLGFNEKVTDMIIDRYYELPKDALATSMALVEGEIITSLQSFLGLPNTVRRHDALLVFDSYIDYSQVAKLSYSVDGFKSRSWFKIPEGDTEVVAEVIECIQTDLFNESEVNYVRCGDEVLSYTKAVNYANEIDTPEDEKTVFD